ncbi:hypothetical protein SAMN04488026_10102 [Aliiruegeria lutimaris]|uniref:Uncharacterized protein n=1 Tax=Aliiruegeria lutimaris TaxID=571298 RepID=A0A1G8Q1N8_9RHOB|nr:hypothetical protein SAMN04488026_10102 [Aliiruegeria lutimaris]
MSPPPPHLQVQSSVIYKDWLVGTFINNHTQKPFIAMESRVMDPVLRLVHYPHSRVTFMELIWDDERFSYGQTDLRFRFHHRDDQPYDVWVTVQSEATGFYFDIPQNSGMGLEIFMAAFIRGGSVCLNRLKPFSKWIFRSVIPRPGLAVAG